MTTTSRKPTSAPAAHLTAHLTAGLALVIALGTGGAYAAGLAKDAVRSPQVKNGSIRGVDLRSGAVTGREVQDGALTGADIDESTLVWPYAPTTPTTPASPTTPTTPVVPAPVVVRGSRRTGVLAQVQKDVAALAFDAPADGWVRVTGSAALNAAPGSQQLTAAIELDGTEKGFAYWDAGDADGYLDQHQGFDVVVPVTAGPTTWTLTLFEMGGTGSSYANAQLVLEFFTEGEISTALPQ